MWNCRFMLKAELLKFLEKISLMIVNLSGMQNDVEVLVITTYILYSAVQKF